MKFELKNIKYFAANSEETPCFNADVYVKGKKFAAIKNDGQGGSNMVFGEKGKDVSFLDGLDVECEIFEMVYEFAEIKKNQSKGLFFKKGDEYFLVKFPLKISQFKKHPQYQSWIDGAKKKFSDYALLNNNL